MPITESIEHIVLRILKGAGGLDVYTIASMVFSGRDQADGPTKSQIARSRRALANLRIQGKIYRLGRAYLNGPQERPREVYADRHHASVYVRDLLAASGQSAIKSRPDLAALAPAPPTH